MLRQGKRRYSVDLAGLQATCEMNYWRLQRLMPDWQARDSWQVLLQQGEQPAQTLLLEVIERCRYTTTIRLHYPRRNLWLHALQMEVRLYHDAHMAEVVAAYDQRRFAGVYPYPNEQMLQPDEKHQLNVFLGEWLGHCQQLGLSDLPSFA